MTVSPDVRIVTDIPEPDPELLTALGSLDLPTFGHILEAGFVRGIHRIVGGETLTIGRVVTVQLVDTDSRMVHYSTALVQPGDFVVIDGGMNGTHASVGGGVAKSYAAAGVVGVAISGTCTDIVELRESGLAVYATGLSAFTTRSTDRPIRGAINVPVAVGGVAVTPGMIAMADENGLLLTTPEVLAGLVERVTAMMAWEPPVIERVRAGERLADHILPSDDLDFLNQLAHRKEITT
ncbi:MAG TPA: RraA family protein [Galbitalea sp.]|nr:RraA family protein [Galbitalea sp.]